MIKQHRDNGWIHFIIKDSTFVFVSLPCFGKSSRLHFPSKVEYLSVVCDCATAHMQSLTLNLTINNSIIINTRIYLVVMYLLFTYPHYWSSSSANWRRLPVILYLCHGTRYRPEQDLNVKSDVKNCDFDLNRGLVLVCFFLGLVKLRVELWMNCCGIYDNWGRKKDWGLVWGTCAYSSACSEGKNWRCVDAFYWY